VLDNIRCTSDVALTPFIFLTAKSDRASMRYGMELGADDYISKPFTTEELLSAIQTQVGIGTQVRIDLPYGI
jgi:DNA-binding response OmpR family regulator